MHLHVSCAPFLQTRTHDEADVGDAQLTPCMCPVLSCPAFAPPCPALQRYKHMMEVNKKYGSFYLESKVYRAWESLDQVRLALCGTLDLVLCL
jgi:hypothetical protein